MPSSDPAQRFEDILANIARIETHTAGIDDETFGAREDFPNSALEKMTQST